MTTWRRTAAAVGAAVCLAAAGCGGSSEPSATTTGGTAETTAATVTTGTAATTAPKATVIAVSYENGTITGGGRREAPVGETVSIRVTSDVADEVHLHGYDKKVDVAPGAPATLTFTADIPGIFEVELESRSIKLIDLVVQ
jgi:hypothetical protein